MAQDAGTGTSALATDQETTVSSGDAPLSAIDWLENVPMEEPVGSDGFLPDSPVVQSGMAPSILAGPLDPSTGPGIGLVPTAVSGLPQTLWNGADLTSFTTAMEALPAEAIAPVQDLRKRLLLASAAPPIGGSAEAFLLARIKLLRDLGLISEAQALLAEAEPLTPQTFDQFADLALLTATEGQACARLRANQSLTDDLDLKVFCLARGSDWSAAALTLQTAEVLGDISPNMGLLLAQFLDPELADGTPPPRPEGDVTPLTMRLYEAIGLPLATRDLPREFAVADLRPELGWKGQLEAAERLARTGALAPNQLLGLYTLRVPAASGGVWDRAAAIQELDAALEGGNRRRIGRALEDAAFEMRLAGLHSPFAAIVANRMDPALDLPTGASETRNQLFLVSPRYEDVAEVSDGIVAGVALGNTSGMNAKTALERAVTAAFDVDPTSVSPSTEQSLGLEILDSLHRIEAARDGDLSGLTTALVSLRQLGLEDAARRAALHLLLEG